MPTGKLFKFKCKELLCRAIIRSDKWTKHCKDKHTVKFNRGLEINHEIIEVRESNEKIWKKFHQNINQNELEPKPPASALDLGLVPSVPVENVETDLEVMEVEKHTTETTTSTSINSTSTNGKINELEPKPPASTLDLGLVPPVPVENVETDLEVTEVEKHTTETTTSTSINSTSTSMEMNDISDYSGRKLLSQTINPLIQNKASMDLNFCDKFVHARWRYRPLHGGGKELRKWLVYSPKKNSIFCFTCAIFGTPGDIRTSNDRKFSLDGYGSTNGENGSRDWPLNVQKNAYRDVENHESQPYHQSSEMAFIRWMSPSNRHRIDSSLIEQDNYWVKHHREVLSVVIDCCRYLSSEMMALRNSDSSKGKLVRLFTAFSKYNPDAKAYLETIENNRNDPDKSRLRVNFLGYHSVLKLIITMKEMVLDHICDQIKKAGKYAIISDSTQDVSKKESVVLIARYIEENEKNGVTTIKPVEQIIGAFTTGITTGAELSSKCLAILEDRGLDKENVIGQSYDGASNMSGSLQGMQSFIQAECPSAVYVWCHAHRFALVVEKSIEKCAPLRNHFGILEELYVFMSGHRRHSVFTECLTMTESLPEKGGKNVHLNKRRLKRVSTTRWSSKFAANSTVHDCLDELLECLQIIQKDATMGKESVAKAAGLSKHLLTFNFIANLIICEEIFAVLSPVTNILQGVQIDFGAASLIISNVIEKLESLSLRKDDDDDIFHSLFKSIEERCSTFNISVVATKRQSIRRRFHDELGIDTDFHFVDKFQDLKVNVWFLVIDELLGALRERFTASALKFLEEANLLTHQKFVEKKQIEPNQIIDLCQFYNFDPVQIAKEMNEFKKIYSILEHNIDVSDLIIDSRKNIKKIKSNNDSNEESEEEEEDSKCTGTWIRRGYCKPFRLISQFSNFASLRALLKILISLPVTSCTAERAFSKHKIIKNHLRSVMLDPYMCAMLILKAESVILDEIKNDEIIDQFAKSSTLLSTMLLHK